MIWGYLYLGTLQISKMNKSLADLFSGYVYIRNLKPKKGRTWIPHLQVRVAMASSKSSRDRLESGSILTCTGMVTG